MSSESHKKHLTLRDRIFQIIFESDTPAAKSFDIALIIMIVVSVIIIMLDSVASLKARYGEIFLIAEWTFTGIFTIEYLLRLYCLDRPLRYARSTYGIIDLLSILPSWLSLLIPGSQAMLVVRVLRVMRLFRVLRLMEFVGEGHLLLEALDRSRQKILMFLMTVISLVIVFGSLVYLIEPVEAGFTSIPRAVYWAVVTLTTVGYGDIAPITPLGQFISALMMILGYSILAVPTGVFSAEVMRSIRRNHYSDEACPGCGHEGHERDAHYCRLCGSWLDEEAEDPRRKEIDDEIEELQQDREALEEKMKLLEQERDGTAASHDGCDETDQRKAPDDNDDPNKRDDPDSNHLPPDQR
ncbi:voltage-gated potassium channel [Kushneria avicenniae]|uniref:Voltage-gated potassium channel n=1 Tax=Kushneria avicenniae TaxID=402385 RepID=A0A1I1KRT4_9GAMM|nr:ion transporter [Kushneria avicenniae]SFC62972.1 voltage-gated potassium channel [Kushneria avicenniae]